MHDIILQQTPLHTTATSAVTTAAASEDAALARWVAFVREHEAETRQAETTRTGRCIVHGMQLRLVVGHHEDAAPGAGADGAGSAGSGALRTIETFVSVSCLHPDCAGRIVSGGAFTLVDPRMDEAEVDALIEARQADLLRFAYLQHNLHARDGWAFFDLYNALLKRNQHEGRARA